MLYKLQEFATRFGFVQVAALNVRPSLLLTSLFQLVKAAAADLKNVCTGLSIEQHECEVYRTKATDVRQLPADVGGQGRGLLKHSRFVTHSMM